jgi:hypothetical protein
LGNASGLRIERELRHKQDQLAMGDDDLAVGNGKNKYF